MGELNDGDEYIESVRELHTISNNEVCVSAGYWLLL